MWSALRAVAAMPTSGVPSSIEVSVPWDVEIDEEIDVEVESIRSVKLPLRR
jgi:hypothetical protein